MLEAELVNLLGYRDFGTLTIIFHYDYVISTSETVYLLFSVPSQRCSTRIVTHGNLVKAGEKRFVSGIDRTPPQCAAYT